MAIQAAVATGATTRRAVWPGLLPLIALPAATILIRPAIPPWQFMWLLAFAIFAGFKWLTCWQARAARARTSAGRSLAYLLLWPGMDADAFLDTDATAEPPKGRDLLFAAAKMLLGAALIWGGVRLVPAGWPVARGWVGMVGLVLLLHFGLFHLAALFWQRKGIQADPIMRSPLAAASLADFWGRRWNLGFRRLSHDLLFEPLARRTGTAAAGLAVFLASGLLHDLVISLPAGDGYGLPTAYFLLQGVGILLERSAIGTSLGLGRGLSGRIFMVFMTAGPAYGLFHPPFIERVILPFLDVIGG